MSSRTRIFNLIKNSPMTVKEISTKLDISETTVRLHCQGMVEMKLIGFHIKHLYGNYHHPYAVYGGIYKEPSEDV